MRHLIDLVVETAAAYLAMALRDVSKSDDEEGDQSDRDEGPKRGKKASKARKINEITQRT
jgi:hypothetical protein